MPHSPTTPATDTTQDDRRLAPGRWQLAAEASRASFVVAHHVFSRVPGELPINDAHLDLDEEGRPVALVARLHSAGFSTGHAKRDGHVRGHVYLQADHFPHVTFAADRIAPAPDGWSVHGTLTVRDATSPLVLHVAQLAKRPDGAVTATATGDFDRFAAGLTAWPTVAVGRRIEFEINALLHPPTTDSVPVHPITTTTRSAS